MTVAPGPLDIASRDPTGDVARDVGARAQALLDAVAPLGCRAMVCYSSGRHFLTDADPVWWLTRHRCIGETIATIAADATVELWVSPSSDVQRAAECVPGLRVRGVGTLGTLGTLGTWSGSAAPVALWGRHKLVARSADALAAVVGDVVDAGAACEEVSRRRTPADLAVLEQASRLAAEGWAAMRAVARPGVAEYEVAAAVQARMRELGAGDTFMLLSSSRHNAALHPPTDRLLGEGDVVLVELSPSVEGMYTQVCRTAVLGTASGGLRADYEVLGASLEAGAAACVPGARCGDVVTAMDAVISDAGYAQYCKPPHMRARGHGLGLASSMPGDVIRDSVQELVEGDFFVLHPNQYLPGSGYLLCGEPLVVTSAGGRPVSGSFAALDEVTW